MTLTAARELVRLALGPQARIWVEPDGSYTLGLDKIPGRTSLAWAETVEDVLRKAFDPHNQEFGRPTP